MRGDRCRLGHEKVTVCIVSWEYWFWQTSDSVCTIVLTVTLSQKKNRDSRGFFVVMSTTNWDLFLGPLEWARAETGGDDR